MKKSFLAFFLLSVGYIANAQFKVELSYGYGTYSMKDMQQLNYDMLESLPVNAKITDNFPGQPYLDAAIYYLLSPKTMLGINCSYHSTGSRISYKDYSGEIRIDNIISAYSPGLILGFKILDNRIKIEQENNFSVSLSSVKIEEDIMNEKDTYALKSFSPQLEPRIKTSVNFGSFDFGVRVGYLIDFKGKTKLDKLSGDTVKNNDGQEIKTNWSGVRFAISASFLVQ